MTREDLLAYLMRRCVVDEDGCWIWKGAVNNAGVPVFCLRALGGVRKVRAAAWWADGRQEIAGRLFAEPDCHPRCCNPKHMLYVTRKQAMERASAKGRLSSGARHAASIMLSRWRGSAVLTLQMVREMRARYEQLGNALAVSREFGISHSHCHRICTHRAWREPSPFSL